MPLSKSSEHDTDELAALRLFMKLMQVWPEDKATWWRKLYFVSYVTPVSLATVLETLFVITEARTEDPLMLLQVCTDTFALGSLAYKGFYIQSNAKSVIELRDILATELNPMEEKDDSVKIKIHKVAWVPAFLYFCMIISSLVTSTSAAWEPPEMRQLTYKSPRFWIVNPITFYIGQISWLWCHFGLLCINSAMDAIIITLSNIVREKSETMQNMFRRLDKIAVTDAQQLDAEVNKIIKYHSLLIKVHDLTESLINRPMLIQLIFLMVGVGTPCLRILLVELETSYAVFIFFYVFWVIGMVLVYFLLLDAATSSASRNEFAAYSAYRPGMTKSHVGKLCVLMGKAQRPLHFTARKIVKINRRTMLKLIKQSYSIYSAVLNLRNI